MLTKEIMGLLGLGIVWINTLLIIAAAFKDITSLFHRMAFFHSWKPGQTGPVLLRGSIQSGQGEDGSVAAHRIEQIGRSSADPGKKAIIFSDRSFASTVSGGVFVPADHPEHPIFIAPQERGAEVWVPQSGLEQEARCPSLQHFDEAYEAARKAKGYPRTVEARIGAGHSVWIAGNIDQNESKQPTLSPSGQGALLISALNPRTELRRRIALSALAIVLIFGAAAGASVLALSKPYFGTLSTVGGGLCLIYFLLVQPAGTALRAHIRLPHLAFLRGSWSRDSIRS